MNPWHGLWRLTLLLTRKILFLWVKTRTLDGQVEGVAAAADHPVCYVLERPGMSDLAVLEQECLRHGLPVPSAGVMVGGREEWRAVAYLRRAARRRRPHHSERLERVAEAVQSGREEDVMVVPVSVFWGRSPTKEKSLFKLMFSEDWGIAGRIRKFFTVIIHGRNVLVQFSQPVSLAQMVEEGPNPALVARKLSRVLRVHFRRLRVATIGPDLSHRRTMVNQVLDSEPVRQAIRREVDSGRMSEEKALARARSYASEIAADYNYTTVRMLEGVLTWLWDRLYDGVQVGHIDRLKSVVEGTEIIYTPCHRSHIDYLLLSYVVYRNGLVPPHIAAGLNLNLPVVGPILRRGGAFFLRRSFRDNALYTAVFRQYLALNLAKGVALEYFIEGGRSRTGRLLPAKGGMLSMTVRAYLRQPERPVVFVPVYFGYERLFEGQSYVSELSGRPKKKESLLGLAKAIRGLRQEFGQVHVNFGEPLALDDVLDDHRTGWRDEPVGPDEKPPWVNRVVDDLGVQILQRINAAAAVSPVNLLATVLLATPRQSMVEGPLCRLLELFALLQRAAPYSDLVTVTDMSGAEMLEYCEGLGLLERQSHRLGDILRLADREAVLATYFRNNVAHLFALPSLVACCFVDRTAMAETRLRGLVRMIYPYVAGELFMRWPPGEVDAQIDRVAGALVDLGLLRREKLSNEPCFVRPPDNSAEAIQLWTLAQNSLQNLERFYVTAALLVTHGSGTLTPAQLEDLCHLMAQRMSALYQFNAPEFFDKALFRGFIRRLRDHDILNTDGDGNLVFDRRLVRAMEDARTILGERLRHDILQAINL
ncbi:MAG: glycerol-3-phosphate 1-O-acyltransferase PlsB [Gammaproteobacteria bacterium]